MHHKIYALVLAAALLAGCAAHEAVGSGVSYSEPEESGTSAQEVDREAWTTLEGTGEAALYIAEGYSLYIPAEGWTLELESGGDIPHNTWLCDGEESTRLTVYDYENVSFMVALSRFTQGSGYGFSEGPTARPGDPAQGRSGGMHCRAVVAEGLAGVTYVIAWEYPEGSGYAEVLEAMAGTFELTE